MKSRIIKYLSLIVCFFLVQNIALAEETVKAAETATNSSSINLPINTILSGVALLLLFIIIIMSMTVKNAIDFYKSNQKNINKITVFFGFLLLSYSSFAEETASATTVAVSSSSSEMLSNIYFYAFLLIIFVEVAIILYFLKMINFLTGIQKYSESTKEKKSLWAKLNQLKSAEEEEEIDIGHDYDGIRELDNVTPPWFTIAFLASIVAAIIYFYRFEIAHTALTQEQEFEIEMRVAKARQDSILKLSGNSVDENNVKMLGEADIASGHKTFVANCAACHGDKGQGGVGPNLTDAYWLHGGSISDVFKSIKYGWVDKGMKSWKDDFSPNQIAQLASFIESLKGTNPPNAKEKQGELYVEKAAAEAPTDSTKVNL
ncbi:MAG: c-type cytochrome [Bacteroidetes bacterium]|nr:c-type cytochrome [Bacteroidota bacterium]